MRASTLLFAAPLFLWGEPASAQVVQCERLISIDKLIEIERTTTGDAKSCPNERVTFVRDRFLGVMCSTPSRNDLVCTVDRPEDGQLDPKLETCGHLVMPDLEKLKDNPFGFLSAEGKITTWVAEKCSAMAPPRALTRTITVTVTDLVKGDLKLCVYSQAACVSVRSFGLEHWNRLRQLGNDGTMKSIIDGLRKGMRI